MQLRWVFLVSIFMVLCLMPLAAWAQESDPETWPIVYHDDFDDPSTEWEVGETEYATRGYVDGAYEIQVKNSRAITWSMIPGDREFLDFAVEVKAQAVEMEGAFGFLFRYVDRGNFYCFTFRADGYYQLLMCKAHSWQTLVAWTPCEGFKSGVANYLKLIAQGETFSFLLNERLLTEVTDADFRGGQIALCACAFDDGGFTVRFDKIALQEDPEMRATTDRSQTLFAEGRQLYQAWNIRGARDAFEEASELFGELSWKEKEAEASLYLGNCWYLLDDYRHAVEHYERSLILYRGIGDINGETTSLNNIGNCYRSLGDYSKAIEYHEASLKITYEAGNRKNEAMSLDGVGNSFFYLGDYDKAIEYYERSLSLYREMNDIIGAGTSLNNIGNCYRSLGDYDKAIEYYKRSLSLYQEANDIYREGISRNNIGNCYRLLGDYSKAIDYYKSSLAIFREIGVRRNEAASLADLGACYRFLGDYGKAIAYYETALVAFRDIGARLNEAECLNSLGDCYSDLGYYPEAIGHSEQGLAIFREIGTRAGEAMSLNNLGNCYSALGNYEKAIDYSEQALAIHREIGARDGERKSLECLGGCYLQWAQYQWGIDYAQQALSIAREIGVRGGEASSLGLLGRCYDQLGQHQRAIEYHEQALAIAQEIGARSLETVCLDDLGVPYRKLGDYQEAISLHTKALAIAQEIGTRPLEANALDNLGNCYRETGDYEEALDYFTRGQAICQEIDCLPKQAEGLKDLGLCYEAMENFSLAIDCYTRSLPIAQEIGLSETAWKAEWGLGKAHWHLGELDLAREEYEQAIAAVEVISGRIRVEELRQSYTASVRELYEEYMELLIEVGEEEGTQAVNERARARDFLNALAASPAGISGKAIEEGIQGGIVDAATIEQNVQDTIRDTPEDTAILEYCVTSKEVTYVWVTSGGDSYGPIQLPHGRAELMHKVIECRRQIEQADSTANLNLAILYDWLIRPVEDLLPHADEDSPAYLIIVPSGPLYYLPFQALIWTSEDRTDHAYLVDRYAISYSPSLTMIKYAEVEQEQTPSTTTFFALANPDTGDPDMRLPAGQREAYRVAACFPVAAVYVGEEATEECLSSHGEQARFVLISAHGVFEPNNPMHSYLLLSPTEESDGKLRAYEVFDLSLAANMVVLSACETLLPSLKDMQRQVKEVTGNETLNEGQLKALTGGDDLVGLTRSFLVSGAASVLASLWSVHSEATEKLIISFYRHLEDDGMDKAEALRAAQIDVMTTPDKGWDQPYFWAAFNLVGDWK
jgi:tetratricopeptide (TPR) repeat protein